MSSSPNTPSTTAPDPNKPVIDFRDVHLGFPEGEVLRGISFTAKHRETLVLLGETGTGKTLTLKLAVGLMSPDRGEIEVLGQRVSGTPERDLLDFRRNLGFVFQEGALFDSLTVGENVAYRLIEDRQPPEVFQPRVEEILRFVELEHTMDMLPSELSGGMRRRVSIARALINRPKIVLYDSPTAGLDPVTSQTIITLILRLRDVFGVTALLATHRLQDGFALANFHFDPQTKRVSRDRVSEERNPIVTRFLVLRDGKVYFEGFPEELLATKDPYLQRFLI
ncbi:MAG TPA: ATP-binding cassette domain-containing protein [Candidatus Acidoferrum sp.]|jgi:phospholipid/cholesterol/gamma-HCH transport system ATP-binding protein